MPAVRATLAPLQAGMFDAPLSAEGYHDLHISDRVLGPTCTATVATATFTCTEVARKRTEEDTGPVVR